MVRVLYYVTLAPLALLLAGLAFRAGNRAVDLDAWGDGLVAISRVTLGLVLAAVAVAPLVRSSQGLQPELRRLLLLPISMRSLHLADALSGLSDPWVAVVIPALLALPAGLASAGGFGEAAIALAGGVGYLLVVIGASSALASGAMLLFRDRRRAEAVTLVLVGLLVAVSLLPLALQNAGDGGPIHVDLDEIGVWLAPLPSELFAGSLARALAGADAAALGRLALLGAEGAALFLLSAFLHRRLVVGVESLGPSRRASVARERIVSLPLADPATAAVALTSVKTALRTVRGRTAVWFFGAVMLMMSLVGGGAVVEQVGEHWRTLLGPAWLLAGYAMALLSLQPIVLNAFAIDGPGSSLLALAPISARHLVGGKLYGAGIVAAISLGLALLVSFLRFPGGRVDAWLTALLAAVAATVSFVPIAIFLSILFPKRADLGKIGHAGNAHAVAAFIGVIATLLCIVPPAGLFLAPAAAGRPAIALGLVAGWCALCVLFALVARPFLVATFEARRENLLSVAVGR